MSILSLTYDFPPRPSRGDGLLVLILSAWGGLAVAIAASGLIYTDERTSVWLFPLLIFSPVALFALGLGISASLRAWALGLDRRLLIGVHAMRTIGLSFVFLYFYDVLPAGFAFPAGVGDAIVAVWAVWLNFSLARGVPVDDAVIARWNWFGSADFLIAVATGLALRSANFGNELSTDAMGTLPLALIPLFAVPMLAITHLIIAMQLRVGSIGSPRGNVRPVCGNC